VKRAGCIALILLLPLPAFSAARKITVAELQEMLATMHKQGKSDEDVASALKQVMLTEQLDRATMNNLMKETPGRLATEQLYAFEARSALLPPPPSGIPATPPLDPARQQALLTKAASYASGTWTQLPSLTATRTTLRFQDNVEALADASGMRSGSTDPSTGLWVNPYNYIHYINSSDTEIALEKGTEKLPKDTSQWGRNKMIESMEPDPDLATIFADAMQYGSLKWERWQLVNGKPAAVFSYDVPKKKSRMAVDVCCFPQVDQAGVTAPPDGSRGNFQTNTDWNHYKEKNVGYHGEFFIDPDTGVIVRMNTIDEQKSSDMVHQLDTRMDYGPVAIGGKILILPTRSFMITEVVPNGEAGAGGFSTRTTLFISEYKNYAPGR
jgi:hypothetical protein